MGKEYSEVRSSIGRGKCGEGGGGRMKVNKAIQELLVENLTDWLDRLYGGMRYWISKIEEAETVEDIMRYKKDMLVDYVKSMPIRSDGCYFCLLYLGNDCEEVLCEYGVVHGFCNDEGSDYDEIRKLRNKLRQRIEEKYYRGESYDCATTSNKQKSRVSPLCDDECGGGKK